VLSAPFSFYPGVVRERPPLPSSLMQTVADPASTGLGLSRGAGERRSLVEADQASERHGGGGGLARSSSDPAASRSRRGQRLSRARRGAGSAIRGKATWAW
jgi:hypothetical protein